MTYLLLSVCRYDSRTTYLINSILKEHSTPNFASTYVWYICLFTTIVVSICYYMCSIQHTAHSKERKRFFLFRIISAAICSLENPDRKNDLDLRRLASRELRPSSRARSRDAIARLLLIADPERLHLYGHLYRFICCCFAKIECNFQNTNVLCTGMYKDKRE